jgi:3-methyladenine DNA glycosylase AlkD
MPATSATVRDLLKSLERKGSKKNVDGMARYGIVAKKVYGVSVADIRAMAKDHRRDHELALALWDTGWYEARMMSAFVDNPKQVTPAQMDRQARDFDNWAICDTHCFHLYDKTPHAWSKIGKWAKSKNEFVKRAAFATLASVALHDKKAPDELFMKALPLIERAANDERNFVKKGVSWALRGYKRRSPELKRAAIDLANRLAESEDRTERWIGKDALRDLTKK